MCNPMDGSCKCKEGFRGTFCDQGKNCYPQLLHTDHCFPLHFSTVEFSLLLVAKSMLTLCYTNIDPHFIYFRFDLYLSSIKSEFMTSNTF